MNILKNAVFTGNLEAIRRLNPDLVDRIRAAPSLGDRLQFSGSRQDAPTARLDGTMLASAVRPLDEADRLAQSFEPVDVAVPIILGFGLGYHIRSIVERLHNTGFALVYEPDVSLLRAVLEHLDCSEWLNSNDIYFFTEADCRTEINRRLDGRIAIVAQGSSIIEHPPSRTRLAESAGVFSTSFAQAVQAMRTTLATTLVHSVTTCRNLCLNLDRYAAGEGISPLKDWARGHGAIVIAAGPSLARNVHLLESPEVRARTVIIAVQTALKPLLARGIKPHFVTALDYHEISRQFYDGLTRKDVEGITLVCEPKANRAILDCFPGKIRCVGNHFLHRLLGPVARDMGTIKPGATVAHLNFVLAQYLGCDPIVFVGQDLGFSECLYYGPGAVIHEQWAPELNRFNTIEMMEWQRVARMKAHLREAKDFRHRPILIDEQMSTYLKLFEAEFAEAPQRIIDATEGGSFKKHTEVMPLRDALEITFESPALLPLPTDAEDGRFNPQAISRIRKRVREVRQRVLRLRDLSHQSADLLDRMLEHQTNQQKMDEHFDRMDEMRAEVENMGDTMELVGSLNQLGIFNRIKADRALTLAEDLDELTQQRRQIERDKVNVVWIRDACDEFMSMLDESDRVLCGNNVDPRIGLRLNTRARSMAENQTDQRQTESTPLKKIAALIAADPTRNGLLLPRSLDESFLDRSVLQCTLQRLDRCRSFDTIILNVPRGFNVSDLFDPDKTPSKRILIHESASPLYDSQHSSVAIGRRWSNTSWRGGIAGLTTFDEIICPKAMLDAMSEFDLDAALIVGSDWPFVDPSPRTGCDALVERFRELPDSQDILFSQAPPGLNGCVLSRVRMEELANRDRRSSIGAVLTYIPHLPQRDPVTMDLCIKLPAEIRNSCWRVTFDSESRRKQLCTTFESIGEDVLKYDSVQILSALDATPVDDELPQHIEIELTTRRCVTGPAAPPLPQDKQRNNIELELIRAIATTISARDDVTISLHGVGDPIFHPDFKSIITLIRNTGISAIHIQTDLLEPRSVLDDLLHLPIDVISVNLNADRNATYQKAMGADRFSEVIANLEQLINKRNAMARRPESFALPWIVPTLAKIPETVHDVRSFFDRWIYFLNAATVEPLYQPFEDSDIPTLDSLIHLPVPPAAQEKRDRTEMLILADGSVPLRSDDRLGNHIFGNINETSVREIWPQLLDARRKHHTRNRQYVTASVPSAANQNLIAVQHTKNLTASA